MAWYYIVAITVFTYWIIGTVWAVINEDTVVYWAVGLAYPIVRVIFYPVRAIKRYNSAYAYYEKHGISKMAYLFGKRVR